MEDKKIWGIHTLNDHMMLDKNLIAIGWTEMGNLSGIPAEREAFKQKYREIYPDAKVQSVANSAGMLYRFVHEAAVGDYVILPSKFNREINIGLITGEYVYLENESQYPNSRSVKWLKHFPRTKFSQAALYEAGSALTFFQIKNNADEYLSALGKTEKTLESPVENLEILTQTTEETIESTKDYILKTLSHNLKGYPLESFVADLLNAMGYNTTLSPQGGDRGIDITAYKDELPPRILVQVKSVDNNIKESTVQSLKGVMKEGDYGLFVTLTDYTPNAKKYLEETPIIRGINGSELADLILKYYDLLSDKYKKMIPLKKVYVPMPEEK